MVKKWVLGGLLLLLLSACQPDVVEIEVTRLVEMAQPTESETETAVSPNTQSAETDTPPTPEIQLIEVTRIVTQEVIVEAEAVVDTKAKLGSAERPVQLLFPPDAGTAVINLRGQAVADVLNRATGLEYRHWHCRQRRSAHRPDVYRPSRHHRLFIIAGLCQGQRTMWRPIGQRRRQC